jgi:hypothetical protein
MLLVRVKRGSEAGFLPVMQQTSGLAAIILQQEREINCPSS